MQQLQTTDNKKFETIDKRNIEREEALAKAKRLQAMEAQAKIVEARIKDRRRMEIEREIQGKKTDEKEKVRIDKERDAAIMREQQRIMQEREYERDGVL